MSNYQNKKKYSKPNRSNKSSQNKSNEKKPYENKRDNTEYRSVELEDYMKKINCFSNCIEWNMPSGRKSLLTAMLFATDCKLYESDSIGFRDSNSRRDDIYRNELEGIKDYTDLNNNSSLISEINRLKGNKDIDENSIKLLEKYFDLNIIIIPLSGGKVQKPKYFNTGKEYTVYLIKRRTNNSILDQYNVLGIKNNGNTVFSNSEDSTFLYYINTFLKDADRLQPNDGYAKALNAQNRLVEVPVYRDIGNFVPKNITVNEYSNADSVIRFTRTKHEEVAKSKTRNAEVLMLVLFLVLMIFVVAMQLR